MKKVKILHITFNMAIGGTEQVIRQIIKNSATDLFQHEILCIDGSIGPLGRALMNDGIHIESFQRTPGTDFNLIRFVKSVIKARDINILHCHQYTPYFYGVVGAFGTGVKVIFTEHGRFYPDRHHFKRRFINPLLVFRTARIIAISKSTADAVAKYEYIKRNKIEIIYNGIMDLKDQVRDRMELLEEIGLSPGYRYIGTISRLEPIKNQTMMINAYYKVKAEIPDIKLILIGDGAEMLKLKKQVKELDIEQDVVFTGFLDNPQRFINIFEIFLLSSFSEGTSMTLLEAMSLSKPCIVTDVGGNPEIVIDGETGVLVPGNDVNEFSNAITRLLADDNTRLGYGVAGRARYLEKFTVCHMVSAYERCYLGN